MNISIFTHYFVPEIGAPALRIYETAREWVRQGHSVKVVTGFPQHPFGQLYPGYHPEWYRVEELDGIHVHRCRTYLAPNRGTVRRTFSHLSFLPGALLTGRCLQGAEVVIATSPPLFAATAAACLARIHRIPFILEVRDLWPGIFSQLGIIKNRFLLRLLELWELALYKSADQIITVTRSFSANISRRGVPLDRINTIPNGADICFWKRSDEEGLILRRSLGLENRFIVLYAGSMGLAQGLVQLLDAAHLLEDRPEVIFLLVGEGAEKDRLRRRIDRHQQRNVVLLDAVDRSRVREFYSMADLCFVSLGPAPLLAEFIPSKIFEMMAMERPIIASLSGEAARIIEEAAAGLVVTPGNPNQIAAAIRSLLDRPQVRQKMGETGRIYVRDQYSRSLLSQRYLQILQRLPRR